ncbi:hypothetical protein [Clostridium beijerinckii]|uniref:hypothetical protein n=1 Tax=Clostridium beijerinckii TaxID=1520 RepID=UPI00098C8D47|nr:hypothetical protein [Clostridium beijerinckii]MBA8933029.1 hypothetical protein [Clostridium beijerinckii]NRU37232.1 hypothetical protein [Clostridium beijerinckii]NSA99489.1 hypothetical protein [Clostridium beijerinckii]OOM64644.1 hypothetical protein CLOBI_14990 [Clostridium beijerinckii]OOM72365.1 hypothetical protein CLBEIC_06910 [Clostridium beijerinckii]
MEKTFNEQQFEGLQSASTYILKLINGINMYFNYIKDGQDDEASNLLSYIVEGIDWINEIARLTKDIQKENMDEEIMEKYLSELEMLFNNGSTDEVNKILEKRILSLLNEWKNIISISISA